VSGPSRDDARDALARFAAEGRLVALEPHAAGLINHSWLASLASHGATRRYLLQQINRRVFRRPEQVLENMLRVTRHLAARLAGEAGPDLSRRVLALVPTLEGAPGHVDARGETWRLLPWIEGARAEERAATQADARETARAFGAFARQLADLGPPALHATIPGFHDTQARVGALEAAVARDEASRAREVRREIDALLERRALAAVLDAAGVPPRPVHNDAKVANVLFDARAGGALAVVDLDTTMPGLVAHDFGDLVRTAVSDSAEDERDLARIGVRMPVFAALAEGYLAGIAPRLTADERAQLVPGARAIVYEQAIRFLADHLNGDTYYRISRPGHNLDRARAQLSLLLSLEAASPGLEAVVAKAAP
jgi:Ser/Thr protein kinase RdoA (MazF antagonist)